MRTLYFPVYTLRPYERGMGETLGKYSGCDSALWSW